MYTSYFIEPTYKLSEYGLKSNFLQFQSLYSLAFTWNNILCTIFIFNYIHAVVLDNIREQC